MANSQISEQDIVHFLSKLWQLNRRVKQDAAPILEAHGLDLRRFFILVTIRKGTVYPKEISEKLQIPSSLLSRYIDQLVKQNLLERRIDPQDSRRTQLLLTACGEETFQRAVVDIRASNRKQLQRIDPQTFRVLLNGLDSLFAASETTFQEE